MALTSPRLQSADLVLTCPEPTYRSAQEHPVRSHRVSAATANTFTAPTVDATCVGKLVFPDDGDARGLPAMVLSVSSTTATIDRNWPSVTGVTSISMWLGPDIPVRVTTADASGPPYDVISTDHAGLATEPDDTWNDEYQLVCLVGANAGRAATITDFVAVSGTFVATWASAVAVGDLFLLRQMVKLEADVDATVNPRTLERQFIGTGRIAADVPVAISSEASINIEMGVKMLTASAGSGTAALKPGNLNSLLEDCFTRHSDTGGTVASANATIVNLASSALTQGGFGLLNTGEVIHILATDDGGSPGVIDVAAYGTGQLTHASVAASSIMYASTWYEPKTTGFRSRTWDLFRGGVHRQLLQGCMPSVTTVIERDNIPKFRFAYTAPESLSYPLARPVALGATYPLQIVDNTIPTDSKHSRCMLDGVRVNVRDINIDWGFGPALRASLSGVNEDDGCVMIKRPDVKLTFSILADDDDRSGIVAMVDRIPRRKYVQFLWQKGRATKEWFAIGIPALFITKAEYSYDSGQGVYNCEATCIDPVAAGYAAATYTNLPPISIGWGG